jgi:hypothetical protein
VVDPAMEVLAGRVEAVSRLARDAKVPPSVDEDAIGPSSTRSPMDVSVTSLSESSSSLGLAAAGGVCVIIERLKSGVARL